MTCDICDKIKKRKNIVYASDKVVVFIPDEAIVQGHLIVTPVDHHPILEAIPEDVLKEMFIVANKIGIAVFEALGAQGTNILIQNGTAAGQETPHVMLNIIPRKENDGLDFMWEPKQMSEEEMSTIELQLKEQAAGVTSEEKPKVEEEKKAEKVKEDFKMKSLVRIP